MRTVLFFLGILSIISLSNCVSPKKLYYFHDLKPTTQRLDSIEQGVPLQIKRSDRLNINVSSPEPSLTAFLNPFNAQNVGNAVQQFSNGYLVNDKGSIMFPYIGELHVEGMTSTDAAKMIREKLSVYFKDIFVIVNIAGRVYFVNGRGGTTIQMFNERLTIFEAIAQSGTQDAFDMKNDVWLVREENGTRTMAKLDLNSKNIFTSPYYYLKSNDLLYVKPGRFTTFLSPGSPARNAIAITGAVITVLITLNNIIN